MKKDTLKFGLLAGVISILISVATYLINPKSLFELFSIFGLLGMFTPLIFMWLSAKKVKELNGGYITFGEALVPSFLTYFIAAFFGSFFSYLLINFIDPSLIDLFKEYTMEATESTLRMVGMPEDQILEQMEKAKQDLEADGNPYSFGKFFLSFIGSTIFLGLIFSAIIAAIIKKKEPMPEV